MVEKHNGEIVDGTKHSGYRPVGTRYNDTKGMPTVVTYVGPYSEEHAHGIAREFKSPHQQQQQHGVADRTGVAHADSRRDSTQQHTYESQPPFERELGNFSLQQDGINSTNSRGRLSSQSCPHCNNPMDMQHTAHNGGMMTQNQMHTHGGGLEHAYAHSDRHHEAYGMGYRGPHPTAQTGMDPHVNAHSHSTHPSAVSKTSTYGGGNAAVGGYSDTQQSRDSRTLINASAHTSTSKTRYCQSLYLCLELTRF